MVLSFPAASVAEIRSWLIPGRVVTGIRNKPLAGKLTLGRRGPSFTDHRRLMPLKLSDTLPETSTVGPLTVDPLMGAETLMVGGMESDFRMVTRAV